MATHKELEDRIKHLNIEQDAKDAEIWLLKSEMVDTLKPIKLLSEQSGLLMDMLEEYIDYFKSRKETEKNKQSKTRLVRLLFISDELSMLTSQNKSLQTANMHLQGKTKHLIDVVKKLNQELIKQQNIENF